MPNSSLAPDSYKDTPIGRLPQEWDVRKIGEIFNEVIEPSRDKEKYPLYSLTIENGLIPKTDRYERSFLMKNKDENEFKTVSYSDIVYNPMNLRFGAITISKIQFPITVSIYYNVIRRNSENVDPWYYSALFQTDKYHYIFESVASGSLLEKKRVHWSVFREIKIPCPPHPEQQKIAAILSTVDAAIADTNAIIAKTEQVKNGLMQDLFTTGIGHTEFKDTKIGRIPKDWNLIALEKLYRSPIRDFSSFSTTKLIKYCESGIAYIRSENFKQHRLVYDEKIRYISNEVHGLLNKSYVNKGNLLFSKIGNIGHTDIYDGRFGQCNSNATIAKMDIDSSLVNPEFVKHFLNSPISERQYKSKIISQPPRINLGCINQLLLPLPPRPEQQKIADIISSFDGSLEQETHVLENLVTLREGLVQDLLTGRVRVKTDAGVATHA